MLCIFPRVRGKERSTAAYAECCVSAALMMLMVAIGAVRPPPLALSTSSQRCCGCRISAPPLECAPRGCLCCSSIFAPFGVGLGFRGMGAIGPLGPVAYVLAGGVPV